MFGAHRTIQYAATLRKSDRCTSDLGENHIESRSALIQQGAAAVNGSAGPRVFQLGLIRQCLANCHSWTNLLSLGSARVLHSTNLEEHIDHATLAVPEIAGQKRMHRHRGAPFLEGCQIHPGLCCCRHTHTHTHTNL